MTWFPQNKVKLLCGKCIYLEDKHFGEHLSEYLWIDLRFRIINPGITCMAVNSNVHARQAILVSIKSIFKANDAFIIQALYAIGF